MRQTSTVNDNVAWSYLCGQESKYQSAISKRLKHSYTFTTEPRRQQLLANLDDRPCTLIFYPLAGALAPLPLPSLSLPLTSSLYLSRYVALRVWAARESSDGIVTSTTHHDDA